MRWRSSGTASMSDAARRIPARGGLGRCARSRRCRATPPPAAMPGCVWTARRAMLMDQPQRRRNAGRARRCRRGRRAARWATTRWRGWRAPIAARFAAVAEYLRARGLAAPEIHAADYAQGLLVLEDLGDALFTDVLAQGAPTKTATSTKRGASEVLGAAACSEDSARSALRARGQSPLFAYDEIALIAETDLMPEWFLPLALGRTASGAEYREHRALVAGGAGRHRGQRTGLCASRLSRPESDLAAGAHRRWRGSA